MTYKVGRYLFDNAVVYGSVEFARMLAAGWHLVTVDENGFATMSIREEKPS